MGELFPNHHAEIITDRVSDTGWESGILFSVLKKCTEEMDPVSLGDITSVRLMYRTDTKYILQAARLPIFLRKASGDYLIQEIEGRRIALYETEYYDTSSLNFYHDHLKGRLNRCKVRRRTYCDCNLHYLEIKRKINTGLTKKHRLKLDNLADISGTSSSEFVKKYCATDLFLLFPVIINRFNRITLVNREKTERVTLDFDLRFTSTGGENEKCIPNIVIVEIKKGKFQKSAIEELLLHERVKKTGFSKYCAGISLLHVSPGFKSYKEKLRYIKKITDYEFTARHP
jgi:hypothetical protein